MKKIKLTLSLIILLFTISKSYADGDTFLPVAKIISYKDIYGKYIEEYSQGNATIINKEGYLLTNAHIALDSQGYPLDFFSICLTKEYSQKPDCSYTASLVDSDIKLDISVLKIDKKDTLGKELDFTKIGFLDISYNFQISDKEDLYVIGMGTDLIIKKKVSFKGKALYGNYNYLKSDGLIPGANSAEAFINKDGKLIGISSSIVGKQIDPSVLYSLDIKDAKNFLDSATIKNSISKDNLTNYINNKIVLDKINKELKINDSFVNFTFSNDYSIKRYNKDKGFTLKQKSENENLPTLLKVGLERIISVNNNDELLFFLEEKGFYNKKTQKLTKKQIGNIQFNVITSSVGSTEKIFYSALVGNKIVTISLYRPIFKDANKENTAKSNANNLLANLSFNDKNFENIVFNFYISSPKVTLLGSSFSSDTSGNAITYLGSLSDYIQLSIKELTEKDGKGLEVEEIYKKQTIGLSNDYKALIYFAGHKGFIYCNTDDIKRKNEKGKTYNQNTCTINIYEKIVGDNNKEYYINGILNSNKSNMEENLKKVISYIETNLTLDKIGEGKTKIPNVYKNIVQINFKDLKYQSDNFKSVLKQLVKYNLINNGMYFYPDEPVRWKNFIYAYLKFKYNYEFDIKKTCSSGNFECLYRNNFVDINGKKTSLYTVFAEMKIPLEYYVDYEKAKIFTNYFDLKLSGEKIDFSEEMIRKYSKLKEDTDFSEIKQKVDLYNNSLGNEQIDIYDIIGISKNDDISYFQTREIYFMIPSLQIVSKELYKKGKYDFKSKYNYSNLCAGENKNKCYRIMTKSMMIDIIAPEINFTIFDKTLIE